MKTKKCRKGAARKDTGEAESGEKKKGHRGLIELMGTKNRFVQRENNHIISEIRQFHKIRWCNQCSKRHLCSVNNIILVLDSII